MRNRFASWLVGLQLRVALACVIGRYSPITRIACWHDRVTTAFLRDALDGPTLTWCDLSPIAPRKATLAPAVWPNPSISGQSPAGYQEAEPTSFVRAAKDPGRSDE